MAEDLKIKLSVDISDVEKKAQEIPDVIERARRRPPPGGRKPAPRPTAGGQGGSQGGQAGGGQGGTAVPPPTPPGGAGKGTPSGDDDSGSGKGRGKGRGKGKATADAEDMLDEFEAGLGKSIKRTFSPLNLLVNFLSWVGDEAQKAMQKASQLVAISRATDIGTADLQKLGYAAEQAGVKAADFYNALEVGKQKMGKGVFGGGDSTVALQRLGFTMEQVRTGAVTSRDVLMRLADVYKTNGNQAQVAAIGAEIYGDSFHKMIPLLRLGSEGIEKLGESAPYMSDNTVRALNSMSKAIDTLKEAATSFIGTVVAAPKVVADNIDNTLRVANAIRRSDTGYEALELLHKRKESGISTPWSSDEVDVGMREADMSDEQWADAVKKFVEDNKEFSGRKDAILADLPKFMADLKAGKVDFNTGSLPSATSLQAMGGGDVFSAINRGPMEDIALYTRQTAEHTRFLAEDKNNRPPMRLLAPGH